VQLPRSVAARAVEHVHLDVRGVAALLDADQVVDAVAVPVGQRVVVQAERRGLRRRGEVVAVEAVEAVEAVLPILTGSPHTQ
jgi:hypothetical protein